MFKKMTLLLWITAYGLGSNPTELPEPILHLGEHLGASHFFQKISDIAISEVGHVYVLDRDQHQVLKYDLKGDLLTKFGQRGQGPGEFSDARQLATLGSYVWIADFGNARIQIFKNDQYFNTLKLTQPAMPRNLAVVNQEIYVGPQSLIPEFGVIPVFSPAGQHLRDLKMIETDLKNWGSTTSLWRMFQLSSLGQDRLIYGFHYDNALLITDLHGEILQSKEMSPIYERFEDDRGAATFPAGYAAMAFSDGPAGSIFVATCSLEERECGMVYQLDGRSLKPFKRFDFGTSVRAITYDDTKNLLLVALSSEVLVYGLD